MDGCIFCKIIAGTIPSAKVYENGQVYAFNDLNPQAPVHILIVPKEHVASIRDITAAQGPLLAAITEAANAIADEKGIGTSGYRLVVNYGPQSGHTVWHLHYHLLGGSQLGGFGVEH